MAEALEMESSTPPDLEELDPSSTLLDLTSYQLHDLDSVELPPNLTELDLTANRLSNLDPRIGQLPDLKKLSLRQNLIADAAVVPLSSWNTLSSLEELVFRDNQLKNVPEVSIFKRLLVFDLSFNEIASLHGVSRVCNTLKELYVSKNEVTKIEEIEHFHLLQILELGSNKLRSDILKKLDDVKIAEEDVRHITEPSLQNDQQKQKSNTIEDLHVIPDVKSNLLVGDVESQSGEEEDNLSNSEEISSSESDSDTPLEKKAARKEARKENKKKVKEEKREARKTKVPKAVKKRKKKLSKAPKTR